MKAITIKGMLIRMDDVKNDPAALRYAVGGPVGTVPLHDGGVMVFDREAQQTDKPYNTLASLVAGVGTYGTALIAGMRGDAFCDVPEAFYPLLQCGEV